MSDQDKRILVEISAGELVDKITILQIKVRRLKDPSRLARVKAELTGLLDVRRQWLPSLRRLRNLAERLATVNRELWQLEDAIRRCESRQDFGPGFVKLARGIYRANDRRSEIKAAISELSRSRLAEVKVYARAASRRASASAVGGNGH